LIPGVSVHGQSVYREPSVFVIFVEGIKITFKSGESKVFSSPALDVFDSVDDDGPSQNVGQAENMELFKRCARLRGQVQKSGPVFGELTLVQGVVKLQSLLYLPLFPTRVKPRFKINIRNVRKDMGGNSQSFLRKFVIFFLTLRC
jgi:hypothetical protein